MLRNVLLACSALLLMLVGCSHKAEVGVAQSLLQKRWVLSGLSDHGSSIDLDGVENEVFVTFEAGDKGFYGIAGCNHFFGNYQINKNTLNTSGTGMTRKMCSPKSMEIESIMAQLISNDTIEISLKSGVLTLQTQDISGQFVAGD